MPTIVLAVPAGRRASFAPALTQFVFFAAASAPTPLRAFHQARWGFSPAVLTPVFAVYALAPPVALLTTGSLSDRLGGVGRIFWGTVIARAAAMGLYLADGSPGALIVARAARGPATGVTMSVLGAALVDADRERGSLFDALAPPLGLGAGALASGGIALLAGDPTRSVFLAALFPGSGVIVVLSHSAAGSSPGSNRRRSPG